MMYGCFTSGPVIFTEAASKAGPAAEAAIPDAKNTNPHKPARRKDTSPAILIENRYGPNTIIKGE